MAMMHKLTKASVWAAFTIIWSIVAPICHAQTGSLSYEYRNQQFLWPEDVSNEDSAKVNVRLSYPTFERSSEQPALDSLQSYIERRMLAPAFESEPIGTPRQLADQVFRQYIELTTRIPDYHFPWKIERSIKVLLNHAGLITLHFSEYTYTGGAHPNSWEFYATFQLDTGRELLLSDILTQASQKEELRKIAERRFRSLKGIPDDHSLKSMGYWFPNNHFTLSENFGLGPNGLIFYYNNYDIAPYAMGATKLVIPYKEVSSLLPADLYQKLRG
jgi:hypothetical protein